MTNGKHIRNVQMIGNAGLMGLPKTAFLSSRKVAPAAVMRCYDWATGMRGGGRGATALPSGHAGRVTLGGRRDLATGSCDGTFNPELGDVGLDLTVVGEIGC